MNTTQTTQLVLLRHGQSIWNRDKIFTGWSDVPLSPKGKKEAENAGQILKHAGYQFDLCFSSILERSVDTLQIVLSTMAQSNVPTKTSWHLNERHYGALEGMSRWGAIIKFGIWPVLGCQLQFNAAPPSLDQQDARFPGNQPQYNTLEKGILPLSESMQQTHQRVKPYWQKTIEPELISGKRILIVSHKNTLRTLMMQLDGLTQRQVMTLRLATARPLVYELDQAMNTINRYYASEK